MLARKDTGFILKTDCCGPVDVLRAVQPSNTWTKKQASEVAAQQVSPKRPPCGTRFGVTGANWGERSWCGGDNFWSVHDTCVDRYGVGSKPALVHHVPWCHDPQPMSTHISYGPGGLFQLGSQVQVSGAWF